MQRFVVIGLALLVTATLLTGCNGGDNKPQVLAFGSAPWNDGDKLFYEWQAISNNARIGTSDYAFSKDGEAWVISCIEEVSSSIQEAGATSRNEVIRINASNLQPIGEEKTIKTQALDITVNTAYKNGKLEIKATQNDEDKSTSIDAPANAVGIDQLLMTLRALPFSEGYEGQTPVVVAQDASVVNTTVRVLNQEQVEVPAGNFNTWKVELDFSQAKQYTSYYAWYQVEAPHNLIQYDNGNTKMVLTQQ